MSQSSDPEKCTIKWCDEPAQHIGNHCRYVGELMFDGWQVVSSINVTLEGGPAETKPRLVLTVAATRPARYNGVALSWPQVDELTTMLTTAGKRYR